MQTPLVAVKSLKEQGMSDNQVLQTLQKEGYSTVDILDAIELVKNSGMPFAGGHMIDPQNPMTFNPQSANQYGAQPAPAGESDEIESLIEQVIAEKWDVLDKHIQRLNEWKERTDQRMTALEQQIIDLKQEFSLLQKAVIGKVGEYDKNVLEVSTQLGAMEKAFSQILPQFVQNINELNRVADRFKKME